MLEWSYPMDAIPEESDRQQIPSQTHLQTESDDNSHSFELLIKAYDRIRFL